MAVENFVEEISDIYNIDKNEVYELFRELDENGDGRIDVHELSKGLKRLGVLYVPEHAQKIIDSGDVSSDNQLSLEEFLNYYQEHEHKLWLIFKSIDSNNSGTVSRDELENALRKLGVNVESKQVNVLFNKMDANGSLQIDWNQWKKFHFLNPDTKDIKDMVKFWRHSGFIDMGDDMLVPIDFTDEEKRTGMWWKQLLAGGVAGVVSRTFTAPLDRLKVLLQIQSGNKTWSISRGFSKMYTEGGLKSLWRGNLVNCVKIAPESSIKFFAYERIKKLFTNSNYQLGVQERFLAGSLAGICSQFSIYPMEVMKTRLAISKTGQYNGFFDCAGQIYRQNGIKGFYKGLVPGLIGVIPYAGIDLCVYETLKSNWSNKHKNENNPGVGVMLLCGAISCTCGMCASYPLSLVRTKLQAQSNDPHFEGHRAKGTMDMFRLIISENGVAGLYRGIFPNFLKVAPAVSVSYVVYELTKRALGMS
ncbi:mitochondrial adenyl nucleotide antiporter SLC25A24 isoform X3 [Hydra vulgaris]|uniref:Mitochondrial adenyl nucleotide antiporter SLC25A24 isoform X3 n=1 Tax=Hydra vulgaris TaxID=6087 RepID=A0ABM4BCE4_HYDVU